MQLQESKIFCSNYLRKFSFDLYGIWLRCVGVMNLTLIFSQLVCWSLCFLWGGGGTSIIQGREYYWRDFIKYAINIVLCQHDCTLQFDSSLNDLSILLTHGDRVTGKLELVLSFCCKVAWSNSTIHDGWLCKGDGCEESLYGKHGLFEHLLFLFSCLFIVYVAWGHFEKWKRPNRLLILLLFLFALR